MTLSRQDQLAIVERQRSRCALCGDPVLWKALPEQQDQRLQKDSGEWSEEEEEEEEVVSHKRHPLMISWDRINVNGGYALDNVQACHVACNTRRQNLSMKAFYQLARLICWSSPKDPVVAVGVEEEEEARHKLALAFLRECNAIDAEAYEDEVTRQMAEGSALARTANWGIFHLQSRFCSHHAMNVIFRSERAAGPFRCMLCQHHTTMSARNRRLHRVNSGGGGVLKSEMAHILREQHFACAICKGALLVRGEDLVHLVDQFSQGGGGAARGSSENQGKKLAVTCHKRHMLTLSWDRKDCNLGYTRDNVQAVHFICNKVKNDLDNDQLAAWLGKCLSYAEEEEEEEEEAKRNKKQ